MNNLEKENVKKVFTDLMVNHIWNEHKFITKNCSKEFLNKRSVKGFDLCKAFERVHFNDSKLEDCKDDELHYPIEMTLNLSEQLLKECLEEAAKNSGMTFKEYCENISNNEQTKNNGIDI